MDNQEYQEYQEYRAKRAKGGHTMVVVMGKEHRSTEAEAEEGACTSIPISARRNPRKRTGPRGQSSHFVKSPLPLPTPKATTPRDYPVDPGTLARLGSFWCCLGLRLPPSRLIRPWPCEPVPLSAFPFDLPLPRPNRCPGASLHLPSSRVPCFLTCTLTCTSLAIFRQRSRPSPSRHQPPPNPSSGSWSTTLLARHPIHCHRPSRSCLARRYETSDARPLPLKPPLGTLAPTGHPQIPYRPSPIACFLPCPFCLANDTVRQLSSRPSPPAHSKCVSQGLSFYSELALLHH